MTALHYAARNGVIDVCAELHVGGADQTIMDKRGYRRAAHSRADGPHARSVQVHASPIRTISQQARRVRRGGGAGAAAASARSSRMRGRSPPPASSRTPRVHSRGAACRGRVLRRRPTHPRHDLRVALRASHRSHRAAADRARTYRIAAHSEGCAAQAALTGTWLATHCEFGFVSALS
jgi:hypothetical protein